MRPPSYIYKKKVAELVGDSMYMAGVKKDIKKGNAVKQGMEGEFGALLLLTIESIERECYRKMVDYPAWRIFEQIRARSELSAMQHLKGSLMAYVQNSEALYKQIELEESGYE